MSNRVTYEQRSNRSFDSGTLSDGFRATHSPRQTSALGRFRAVSCCDSISSSPLRCHQASCDQFRDESCRSCHLTTNDRFPPSPTSVLKPQTSQFSLKRSALPSSTRPLLHPIKHRLPHPLPPRHHPIRRKLLIWPPDRHAGLDHLVLRNPRLGSHHRRLHDPPAVDHSAQPARPRRVHQADDHGPAVERRDVVAVQRAVVGDDDRGGRVELPEAAQHPVLARLLVVASDAHRAKRVMSRDATPKRSVAMSNCRGRWSPAYSAPRRNPLHARPRAMPRAALSCCERRWEASSCR